VDATILGLWSATRKLFSWFWNFPDCKLADSGDLDQFVQQEIFIPGFLNVLDNRKEPLPLFLPAQATCAQDYQSRMNRRFRAFVVTTAKS